MHQMFRWIVKGESLEDLTRPTPSDSVMHQMFRWIVVRLTTRFIQKIIVQNIIFIAACFINKNSPKIT
jgi:hypothetical protein